MVASAATTPADTAPGGTTVGGQSDDSSSSPSTALPRGDSASSPLPIDHCPLPASALLDLLASPHHSLASIAEHHNISLSTLLAWLELPAIREKMALRESIAYRHVRYVAALNLSHAVHTTIRTLEAFNAIPRPADPLDPNYLRAAVHARKAAWLLLRFSRLTPIADPDLSVAHNTLRGTQSVSRYAEGGEPLPAHPQPAQPTAVSAKPQPSPAHQQPAPAPSQPPAQSHSEHLAVPTTIDPAAGPDAPADHPADPAPASPTLVVLSTPALPDPTDMVALVEQLTALAASLGIGVSDFDDPADIPALVTVGPPDST